MASLESLNESQREAVVTTEGPLLILAGAGTGKTRVITHRVAHLLDKGAAPESILAVTFTNKAAQTMQERIDGLLRAGRRSAAGLWVSTFHSFGARLLRREAQHLGLPRDFAIYDDDDQHAVVREAMRALGLEERSHPPRGIRERISHAKNHDLSPGQLAAAAFDESGHAVAHVFEAYEAALRRNGALDFDDLLLFAVRLLRNHKQARDAWSSRFDFLHVDEYQDTNAAQAELVLLLANARENVCVVGDEDQSIYSWRGAQAGNLQRFCEDFPRTKIVRLEENYRSTQTILDAAAAVVAHNTNRLGKTLKSAQGAGSRLRFFEGLDASEEAAFVAGEIAQLMRAGPDAHIAVLYRTTAQSRAFEEALRRLGLRYRVLGGFSFYQRAEIKDALAYVRLILHPEDDIALLRVLNVPPRGIGKMTIAALRARAQEAGQPLWEALAQPGNSASGRAVLLSFRRLVETLREETSPAAPAELLRTVLEKTGYLDWAAEQDRLDGSSRAENLNELATALAEAAEHGQTLQDIMDQAALVSDADGFEEAAPISLMTLHSAKGLEFDHVFLAGLEEGLLPHNRSLLSPEDVEEERRLCYVGMTRAKKTLALTRAVYRRIWGNEQLSGSAASRFVGEIPRELVEAVAGSGAAAESGMEGRLRYAADDDFGDAPHFPRRLRNGFGDAAPSSPQKSFSPSRPRSPGSALVGQRVRHPSYGVGTVLSVEGDGDDRKFTVRFPDYGVKKLVERYAHLEFA